MHAREEGGQWQAKWRLWLGDQKEAGSVQGADQAALADAVMLAVNQRLAPRFVAKPGASSEQLLEVQGMNLERYATLGRLLEPFGARLQSVDGDRDSLSGQWQRRSVAGAVVSGQVAGSSGR